MIRNILLLSVMEGQRTAAGPVICHYANERLASALTSSDDIHRPDAAFHLRLATSGLLARSVQSVVRTINLMNESNSCEIRRLTEDEILRLEGALGAPIDRNYLVHWVTEAIRDLVKLSNPVIDPRGYRDELEAIAQQGRKWVELVTRSKSTSLLPKVLDMEQLISSVRTFSEAIGSEARAADKSVKPGRPQTHLALAAFLDRLIGIAKRAKVLPSTPGRGLRSHTAPRQPPPFYSFVTEALDIAIEAIKSSPLPQADVDRVLKILTPSDQALIKIMEQSRGKIGGYYEGAHGLSEWERSDDEGEGP